MAEFIFFFGGQKSGKTATAIEYIKNKALKKPYYIATYKNDYNDEEMERRVENHKQERNDDFFTIEEGINLSNVVKNGEFYLVDCLSMWILNSLEKDEEFFKDELDKLLKFDSTFVFVLNDVSCGVIPIDKVSRKFVDLSGIVGSYVAKNAKEVYQVSYSIKRQIK